MTPELAVAVVVALFGGGGIAALLRLRGETSRIVVDAAKDVVLIQVGTIERLQAQVSSLTARMEHVEARARHAAERAEIAERRADAAEARARAAEDHRDILLRANTDLRERLEHLEAEVRRLGGTLP